MTITQLIRRIAALVLICFCFCFCVWSWVALGASLWLDWPRQVVVIAVFAAAFSTEAALWGGAVLLGWTALANRVSILGRLSGRGA